MDLQGESYSSFSEDDEAHEEEKLSNFSLSGILPSSSRNILEVQDTLNQRQLILGFLEKFD